MKILVVGGGGREHALVWKLAQSPQVEKLYCAPGNPGIAELATCVDLAADDLPGLLNFAQTTGIDLTVVGPELPLTLGITDVFEKHGLLVAGPSRYTAQLEGSKSFSKNLMRRFGIPTADYQTFEEAGEAIEYVQLAARPLVVKADGLAAGKGVILCRTAAEAEQACRDIMEKRIFGEAGRKVVIEEWLQGEEASFLVFTDGQAIVAMPSSQDHKAIGEGDTGPNTGGMGAYSPAPVLTAALGQQVVDQIIRPLIEGLSREGTPFKGILYAGLMIAPDGGMKVLEFNVRFGDPECQALMLRLESDLAEILYLLARKRLDRAEVQWSRKSAVCVVMSAAGYPGEYQTGQPISGISEARRYGGLVFQAGTALEEGQLVTNGGRVLSVSALGDTISEALDNAYAAVACISWPGAYYRKDIGYRAVNRLEEPTSGPAVGVIMGSASDWPAMQSAVKVLEEFGVTCEARVLSAHRTPEEALDYARRAQSRGLKVIIAGAGWAAHLAGVMAANTILPVIGVPLDSSPLKGLDALLSTVQMPAGIPVATMSLGAGGAKNAGLYAIRILALANEDLSQKLRTYRQDMAETVLNTHLPQG